MKSKRLKIKKKGIYELTFPREDWWDEKGGKQLMMVEHMIASKSGTRSTKVETIKGPKT